MKKLLLVLALIAAVIVSVSAQSGERPRQVLTPDDMTRFISTFEPIIAEFRDTGNEMEQAESGGPSPRRGAGGTVSSCSHRSIR
jgi:hypothetical protein